MKKWILLSGIAIFMFSSCSIRKRNYLAGYYISWKKNLPAVFHNHDEKAKLSLSKLEAPKRQAQLTASVKKPERLPAAVYTGTRTYIDNCDTLFFRNGMVVKARITEISITEVKYRYCNNPDGPILVAKKDDIGSVTYSNGDRDVFTIAPNPRQEAGWKKQDEVSRAKGMASDSYVLGIYSIPGLLVYGSGLITAFLAISRGRNALAVLERNPQQNMASIRKARTGILLGKIVFGIILFLLALLVLAAYHVI